ncbi:MAG: sigma-54-dependent Fis family transcriptional regulator [Kangiellaceae bacterium]|nr:sigma-54-dependent Fis family transcriptional regulator [Kangiellaceae bacterium]
MSETDKPKILVIDDEADIRHLLTMTLLQMGMDVASAKDVAEAKLILNQEAFSFCLTDLKLPDGNGLDIVKYVKQHYPTMPIAVVTAFGSTDNAVEAMKLGAFDFLAKPIDLSHLRQLLKHAFKFNPKEEVEQHQTLHYLVGDSDTIQNLRKQIKKIRGSQAPVVIEGAKGTEKERLAHIIHSQSSRSESSETYFDCSTLEPDITESKLFSHIEGQNNILTSSNHGTLIISNIHLLNSNSQKKLLQILEEKKLYLESSAEDIAIDVRIIVCTDLPLQTFVQSGQLREDLFFRLNVIDLKIPSISQRPQDLNLLIDSYLAEFGENKTLTNKAKLKLGLYSFPFNYRELENTLEKASALADDENIDEHDILIAESEQLIVNENTTKNTTPLSDRGEQPLDEYIEQIERIEIEKALDKTRWNRTEAAKLLGVSFRTIRYKMKKLGIE